MERPVWAPEFCALSNWREALTDVCRGGGVESTDQVRRQRRRCLSEQVAQSG
jgi:hypothetical protein